MIKLAGFWDFSWDYPLHESNMWYIILKEFKIKNIYMTPITGIDCNFVIERNDITEIYDENKELQKVYVSENGEIELQDFVHPKNVLYIFGKTNYSPFNNLKKPNDLSVKISTPFNKGMFLSYQAACIILYDRYIKEPWQ